MCSLVVWAMMPRRDTNASVTFQDGLSTVYCRLVVSIKLTYEFYCVTKNCLGLLNCLLTAKYGHSVTFGKKCFGCWHSSPDLWWVRAKCNEFQLKVQSWVRQFKDVREIVYVKSRSLFIFIINNDLVWALQIRGAEDLIEYFGRDELYHPPSIVLTLLPPFWYLKNGVGSKHFGSYAVVESAVKHSCRNSW